MICVTGDGTYRQGVVVPEELAGRAPDEVRRQLDDVVLDEGIVAAEEGRDDWARGAQHNSLHLDTHENEGGGIRWG